MRICSVFPGLTFRELSKISVHYFSPTLLVKSSFRQKSYQPSSVITVSCNQPGTALLVSCRRGRLAGLNWGPLERSVQLGQSRLWCRCHYLNTCFTWSALVASRLLRFQLPEAIVHHEQGGHREIGPGPGKDHLSG